MNYKDFFNAYLLEAAEMPVHDLKDGAGAEYLAGDDTDVGQLDNDLGVNGSPKSSIEDAKKLWEAETSVPTTNSPEEKRSALKRIEKFLDTLSNYQKNLQKLAPEKKYTDIAILADLIGTDPTMSQKYNNLLSRIEQLKKADELRRQAQQIEDGSSDGEDGEPDQHSSESPPSLPI
jgi:hypothetical protein